MKLKDARETYQYHSGKAGDIGRQLSLAGIAIVWMFRGGDTIHFTRTLLLALAWLCVSLLFDFLQYLFGGLIWGAIAWCVEHKLKKNSINPSENIPAAEFQVWHVTNFPCLFFFWSKFVCLSVGFWFLAEHLVLQVINS